MEISDNSIHRLMAILRKPKKKYKSGPSGPGRLERAIKDEKNNRPIPKMDRLAAQLDRDRFFGRDKPSQSDPWASSLDDSYFPPPVDEFGSKFERNPNSRNAIKQRRYRERLKQRANGRHED